MKSLKLFVLATITLLLVSLQVSAKGIVGKWWNEEKDAQIEVYESNGKFYGAIVYLKNPKDANGNVKTDFRNPDKTLAKKELKGLMILKGFKKKSEKSYEDGTIYDPKSGKTYSCNITVKSDNVLSIRGYIGISLIGRTSTWTRVA